MFPSTNIGACIEGLSLKYYLKSSVPLKSMTEEVVVTRKGQTTVPVKLRRKYGIYEGTRLQVEDTGKGILLRKATSTLELIGSGSKHASVEEMKRLLDEMRAEDQ
jgi:AbrB family looped-hinge helix DNA binding protein